ncbi:MAG: metal-sensitive transcriptional regulator [Gammaproteobacteria bacterium]|nr:metal-sensitive transcriptional regulator [Gammaproteobacteria bacterium]
MSSSKSEKTVVQPNKEALLKRLKRAEGQVRGVARMVEEDRYCIDILTQIAALRSALDGVAFGLIEDHTRGCVSRSIRNGDDSAIDELLTVLKRFTR